MLHQQGTLQLDHLLTDRWGRGRGRGWLAMQQPCTSTTHPSAPGCSPHLVDTLVKTMRGGQSGRTVGMVQSEIFQLLDCWLLR